MDARPLAVAVLLLSAAWGATSRRIAGGESALRFSGTIAQSAPEGTAPWRCISFSGVFTEQDGAMRVIDGRQLHRLTRQEGRWIASGSASLPVDPVPEVPAAWDGRLLWYVGGDWRLRTWPGDGIVSDLGVWKGRLTALAVAPDGCQTGLAARGKVFLLTDRSGLHLLDAAGMPAGPSWNLPPPRTEGSYRRLCLERVSGDLLLASYWPDSRIYRFRGDGSQVRTGGWPMEAFASFLGSGGGTEWVLARTRAWPATRPERRRDIPWAFYANGMADGPDGELAVSSSQGLLIVPGQGVDGIRRIGGMPPVQAMTCTPDGDLVVLLADGRIVRTGIDADADAPLTCNGDEPFRSAGSWDGRGTAIAWSHGGGLLLERNSARLWWFSPDHETDGRKPWRPATAQGSLAGMHLMSRDGTRLLLAGGARAMLADTVRDGLAMEPVDGLPETLQRASSLVLHGDTVVVGGMDGSCQGYTLNGRTIATPPRWRIEASRPGPCHLACSSDGRLVAANADGLAVLRAVDGTCLWKTSARSAAPAGLVPGPACITGPWVFVYDTAGSRILRFRMGRDD